MSAKANQWHPWRGKTAGVERETRQQLRAHLRRVAFMEITEQYGGESRELRRSMALARAVRDYRALKAGQR